MNLKAKYDKISSLVVLCKKVIQEDLNGDDFQRRESREKELTSLGGAVKSIFYNDTFYQPFIEYYHPEKPINYIIEYIKEKREFLEPGIGDDVNFDPIFAKCFLSCFKAKAKHKYPIELAPFLTFNSNSMYAILIYEIIGIDEKLSFDEQIEDWLIPEIVIEELKKVHHFNDIKTFNSAESWKYTDSLKYYQFAFRAKKLYRPLVVMSNKLFSFKEIVFNSTVLLGFCRVYISGWLGHWINLSCFLDEKMGEKRWFINIMHANLRETTLRKKWIESFVAKGQYPSRDCQYPYPDDYGNSGMITANDEFLLIKPNTPDLHLMTFEEAFKMITYGYQSLKKYQEMIDKEENPEKIEENCQKIYEEFNQSKDFFEGKINEGIIFRMTPEGLGY